MSSSARNGNADSALQQLAESVGLLLEWTGSDGCVKSLPVERQRAMLERLGWPAADEAQAAESLARWRERTGLRPCRQLPPLLIADQDVAYPVPVVNAPGMRFTLHLESGETLDGHLDDWGCLPPLEACGYHSLALLSERGGDCITRTLAVAPERCFSVSELGSDSLQSSKLPSKPWGVSVQLYGLQREGDAGIGDLKALDELCQTLAGIGADAVAMSPIHALFGANPEHFSPYSPSSRLFYNVWHAAPECLFDAETLARAREPFVEAMTFQGKQSLIDWPVSVRLKLSMLERLFLHVQRDDSALDWRSRFVAFRRDGGEALECHCRFEVLQAHADETDWRQWPEAWRDPRSAEVEAFAEQHREAVTFAAFLQWLMAAGLDSVQAHAREAGMAIGLIADLAVGVDRCGSQAWSFPQELLTEFSVGAPPDAFNAKGQNWGVAAFSPLGLVDSGYCGFLAMLRAGFAHTGGVRIDHILGFSRLWLVPQGESAEAGAYLRYPLDDMLRLVALESWRHRAIVIGEDLGTVEEGLREQLASRGVLGMSVMWFERDGEAFLPASRWRRATLATTTTHDLPTVAGWWQGNDLRWRQRLDLLTSEETAAGLEESRRQDRRRLAEVCGLDIVADDDGIASDALDTEDVVDAVLAFVASAPTPLVLLPLEDILGLEEQPNLPGTLDEHPNWRRRLPLPVTQLLSEPAVRRRLERIAAIRTARSRESRP